MAKEKTKEEESKFAVKFCNYRATYFLGLKCQTAKEGTRKKSTLYLKLLTCPDCKRIFRKELGLELHAKSIHGKSLDDLKRQVKRPQSSPNKRRKYNSKSKKKRKKSYTSDEESDTEVSEEESDIEEVVEIK